MADWTFYDKFGLSGAMWTRSSVNVVVLRLGSPFRDKTGPRRDKKIFVRSLFVDKGGHLCLCWLLFWATNHTSHASSLICPGRRALPKETRKKNRQQPQADTDGRLSGQALVFLLESRKESRKATNDGPLCGKTQRGCLLQHLDMCAWIVWICLSTGCNNTNQAESEHVVVR